MTSPTQKTSKNAQDIRLKATAKIWSLAIALFAICIPLSAATRSGPILPLAVVVGTTLGTRSIWKGSSEEATSSRQTAEKIKQLEGRIADLETIITSEEINWRYSLEPSSQGVFSGKAISSVEESKKFKQISSANVDDK